MSQLRVTGLCSLVSGGRNVIYSLALSGGSVPAQRGVRSPPSREVHVPDHGIVRDAYSCTSGDGRFMFAKLTCLDKIL